MKVHPWFSQALIIRPAISEEPQMFYPLKKKQTKSKIATHENRLFHKKSSAWWVVVDVVAIQPMYVFD